MGLGTNLSLVPIPFEANSSVVVDSFSAMFWPTFAATVLGGGIVAAGAYWLLDRRLHLRDRADHAREVETTQQAMRNSVLNVSRCGRARSMPPLLN